MISRGGHHTEIASSPRNARRGAHGLNPWAEGPRPGVLVLTHNLWGHCEPTGPRSARPEDRLREAILKAGTSVRFVPPVFRPIHMIHHSGTIERSSCHTGEAGVHGRKRFRPSPG